MRNLFVLTFLFASVLVASSHDVLEMPTHHVVSFRQAVGATFFTNWITSQFEKLTAGKIDLSNLSNIEKILEPLIKAYEPFLDLLSSTSSNSLPTLPSIPGLPSLPGLRQSSTSINPTKIIPSINKVVTALSKNILNAASSNKADEKQTCGATGLVDKILSKFSLATLEKGVETLQNQKENGDGKENPNSAALEESLTEVVGQLQTLFKPLSDLANKPTGNDCTAELVKSLSNPVKQLRKQIWSLSKDSKNPLFEEIRKLDENLDNVPITATNPKAIWATLWDKLNFRQFF